ncbi:MAG: helix-turn-helix domain-containing protein [Nitrososphaerota archaeon]
MLVAALREPSEDELVWLLRYKTRRRILLAIGDAGKISATTLRDTLKISTGSLYYNLRQLRRFVTQDGDKNYMLTEEGLRVYRALKEKGTITAADLMEQNQRSRVFSMFKSAFFPLWLYTPLYEQKTVFMILPALSAILSVALLIYTRQAPLMLHFYRVEPNVFRIAGQYLLNISILYILSTVLSIIFSGALFRGGEEGLMARIRSIAWHSIWDEVKFVGALAVAQLPLMLYPAILSVNKLFSLSIIPAERTAQYYLVTGTLSTISQVLALPLLTGLIAYGRRLDGATAALAALIIFFTSHVVFQAVTFASVA